MQVTKRNNCDLSTRSIASRFDGGKEIPLVQGKRNQSKMVGVARGHQRAAAAAAESLQLCPTLCNPIDGSPPGSPVPGILQARTLEWVATSFSIV